MQKCKNPTMLFLGVHPFHIITDPAPLPRSAPRRSTSMLIVGTNQICPDSIPYRAGYFEAKDQANSSVTSSWPAEILARRRLLISRRHSACSTSMATVSKSQIQRKIRDHGGTSVCWNYRVAESSPGFVRLTLHRHFRGLKMPRVHDLVQMRGS